MLCCALLWLYIDWFPISIRLTSLALWQSNDCPSASKATLMNMDQYLMWIHYERLHNHNKAKHNKTVCIFLGIYCTINIPLWTHKTYPIPWSHSLLWIYRRTLTILQQHCTVFHSVNPMEYWVSLQACWYFRLVDITVWYTIGNSTWSADIDFFQSFYD